MGRKRKYFSRKEELAGRRATVAKLRRGQASPSVPVRRSRPMRLPIRPLCGHAWRGGCQVRLIVVCWKMLLCLHLPVTPVFNPAECCRFMRWYRQSCTDHLACLRESNNDIFEYLRGQRRWFTALPGAAKVRVILLTARVDELATIQACLRMGGGWGL